jgi:hypothetical protein
MTATIPNDPENRYWIDVSSANPKLMAEFSNCLVGFMGFNYAQEPDIAGTGFIVGADIDLAIVITAKHVLTEGVLSIQRPAARHAPSALFVPTSSKMPQAHEEKLRAFWVGADSSDLLYVRHFSYNDSLDIACCVLEPQESCLSKFKPISIPLDTRRPSVGDVVYMVSQGGMEISNRQAPTGVRGTGQQFSIHRRINIRIGTVTAVYPQGFRQYPWQCFTTSIPAEPGMSGGFVYMPHEGKPIGACGIVCADNSTSDAYTDFSQCGESVIACAWPALALPVPQFRENNSPMRTLLDMVRAGDLPPPVGGSDHIRIVDRGNGDGTIERLW